MPSQIIYDSNPTLTDAITTGLNSLADGANAISGEIDNTTSLHLYMLIEVNIALQGSARASDAFAEVYVLPSADGTNFDTGDGSTDPSKSNLRATMTFDAVTAARRGSVWNIVVPPKKFKLLFINETGQALAASGNTLKYALYSPESQ